MNSVIILYFHYISQIVSTKRIGLFVLSFFRHFLSSCLNRLFVKFRIEYFTHYKTRHDISFFDNFCPQTCFNK